MTNKYICVCVHSREVMSIYVGIKMNSKATRKKGEHLDDNNKVTKQR